MTSEDDSHDSWSGNYFNYFTEVEEHFQRARGTALFLMSPLDWALIENWKETGVPLEAVVKGIDDAFEKWRSRKVKTRRVNSLAYCTQAVMEAATRLSGAGAEKARAQSESPFSEREICEFLLASAAAIAATQRTPYQPVIASLESLAESSVEHVHHLEDLERHLTALEEKLVALVRASLPDDELIELRRQLDRELSPYRGKMTADQITMLERRYLDTKLLEKEKLPRLSLFYLRS